MTANVREEAMAIPVSVDKAGRRSTSAGSHFSCPDGQSATKDPSPTSGDHDACARKLITGAAALPSPNTNGVAPERGPFAKGPAPFITSEAAHFPLRRKMMRM
ncbi:hypothetical protein E2C01_082941 [Portunus trituberculatus]|uniref:Uncharacterized protein n=1 Tax=Portunus trituberculatus TaxID=210409 RepID=A0A5B7IR66_PORTR|nr:hypothetical protein [Portunus trituberculatus]